MAKVAALVVALALGACAHGTGVYLNGAELTSDGKHSLEHLIGQPVLAGRYALDADGEFGREGSDETRNIADYVRAKRRHHRKTHGISAR